MIRLLTDNDIERILDLETITAVIERTFLARAEGTLIAPPRFTVEAQTGALVFTAGGETKYTQSIGFRVYNTIPKEDVNDEQLVVVFDSETGALRGLVAGRSIGALRTAAINAVAIKHMARHDAKNLGIIGSGYHARFQLQAALALRPFAKVKVYSRNLQRRNVFADEMSTAGDIDVEPAASAEEVARFADVLICATNSTVPILEAPWIRPGTHVNTIGPKFKGASEIPYQLAQHSQVIATDSGEQAAAYSRPFFIQDMPEGQRMIELSEIVAGLQTGRNAADDISLFCSVGLAGTEVVIAHEALRHYET